MRIAQISPLYESVPPQLYGGTERIVHYLTEELLRQGHEVTLFASADSATSARLEACAPRGLRLDPTVTDGLASHMVMFDRVLSAAARFDVLHFHTDYVHLPAFRHCSVPHLTTFHGRLDLPHLGPVFDAFGDLPMVSISDSQRLPVSQANWLATVQHGLPEEAYAFCPEPRGYLAFVGRISPEKRPDRAIEIAARAGLPLKLAAKVDREDREYFETVIRPLLREGTAEFVGEVDEREKGELLGGALALLFPIDWPEPFGLVMIEALACGTPVIAFRNGSVPEVLRHGATGFIVDSVNEAVAAVGEVGRLSRAHCREEFEARFSARRMAQDYIGVYEELLERRAASRLAGVVGLAATKPKARPLLGGATTL
jgi:glycosyltransferase involved in cell wall biosynthesis